MKKKQQLIAEIARLKTDIRDLDVRLTLAARGCFYWQAEAEKAWRVRDAHAKENARLHDEQERYQQEQDEINVQLGSLGISSHKDRLVAISQLQAALKHTEAHAAQTRTEAEKAWREACKRAVLTR